MVTFTLDGREVTAPQNMMLADAALEYGDVEIPVFCYEKKLGPPVGACRMCLVELEGVPKLQAGCSVPVKEGMVVHTNTPRVHEAQQAVLEFILINHPLDCPVCDKGGECPLQDKSFGWGGGISRFVDPKRHFEKPLALSPLIAIDRERCILCYRCVRFSQEISEDYQLILQERGAGTFVATFDGHPYVAPFSGNIIELCPVGALTSRPYRFRARPWDIEQSGSVCTLCPAQCNVSFTVRDERVLRVLQRDHDGVDDGWLCDKGRFAYQAIHVEERVTQPLLRDGGELRPVSWEAALEAAASGLSKARGRVGALAGGETTNEEGWLLQRLMRDVLGSGDIDSRPGGALDLDVQRALSAPALQAAVPDLQFAHAVLVLDTEPVDDAPILDLRIRKGVRHHGVKLFVASSRPSSLDERAAASVRFAPGGGEALLAALDAALGEGDVDGLASAAGTSGDAVRALAAGLKAAGEDVVILWGERLTGGPRGAHAGRALLNVAARLGLAGRPEGGPDRDPVGDEQPRPARGRRAAERRPGPGRRPRRGPRCPRDRGRRGRRRPHGALPPAQRPARRPPGSRGLGGGAGEGDDRRRARELPHGGHPRPRHRRLPGRVLRREGGHGRAPRRPRAAPAPCDRPSGRDARRMVGPGRARGAPGHRPEDADGVDGDEADARRGAVLRRAVARRDRRARRALARAPAGVRVPRRRRRTVHARDAARRRRRPTGSCAWARSARSGPRPRCRSRPR